MLGWFGECNSLQWSRPQLRTETSVTCRLPTALRPASMEPSSAEDGDLLAARQAKSESLASMEPSSAEDGDDEWIQHATKH